MDRRYDLGLVLTFEWKPVNMAVTLCPHFSTAGLEVKKACDFLLSHQMDDGGWGEDFAVSLYIDEATLY